MAKQRRSYDPVPQSGRARAAAARCRLGGRPGRPSDPCDDGAFPDRLRDRDLGRQYFLLVVGRCVLGAGRPVVGRHCLLDRRRRKRRRHRRAAWPVPGIWALEASSSDAVAAMTLVAIAGANWGPAFDRQLPWLGPGRTVLPLRRHSPPAMADGEARPARPRESGSSIYHGVGVLVSGGSCQRPPPRPQTRPGGVRRPNRRAAEQTLYR